MSQTHSLTGRLAVLAIFQLFVDQFGRSLWFSHPEFEKEAISDDFIAQSRVFKSI